MKFLKFLDDKLEMSICIVLMSVMTVVLFIQVIARYIFSNSLSWSEELARYLFIWLIYLGISYGAKIMKHIKIEAALGLFPKRLRPYVPIVGDLIFLAFALFVCKSSYEWIIRQMRLKQTSPAMGVPMWLLYAAPLVGFALTAIREVQTIIFRIRQIRHPENNGGQAA